MMSEILLDIVVDSSPPHNAGDVLSGRVIVTLPQPTLIHGIRLQVRGTGMVSWTDGRGPGTYSTQAWDHAATTAGDKQYCDINRSLYGTGNMEDARIHPEGRQDYPFNVLLPYDIPPSFEGLRGNVRYAMKVVVETPGQIHQFTKPLPLSRIVDINFDPEARLRQEVSDVKTLCCLCCASGSITAKLSTNRTAFVPGERIYITGEVINNSFRKMKSSAVTLRKTVYYYTRNQKTWDTVKLVSVHRGPIYSRGGREVYDGELAIPHNLAPSYLPYCKIIRITYAVALTVYPAGPHFKLDLPLDIRIGTEPLRENAELQQAESHDGFPRMPYGPDMTIPECGKADEGITSNVEWEQQRYWQE